MVEAPQSGDIVKISAGIWGGNRGSEFPGAVRPGYSPSGTRMGRNDPCWCGSGQKYKKCHGA